jgi:hypothetical protein
MHFLQVTYASNTAHHTFNQLAKYTGTTALILTR